MYFTALFEVNDSAVTLSPILAKYIIKHNRHDRPALKVMPYYITDPFEHVDAIGLDINPPYEGVDKEYQETLNEIQIIPETKEVGFCLESPTVIGLFTEYGIDCTKFPIGSQQLYVKSFKLDGRMMYAILPPMGKCASIWYDILVCLSSWWVRLIN